MRSSQGEDKALPLTLAEEYDLSAFVPLSTTFSPIPPPSVDISPLPQRLAKIRSALVTLIEHQPVVSPFLIFVPKCTLKISNIYIYIQSWAFLLFDEATKTFTATISMVIKTPAGDPRSQSQRGSGSGSSSYSQQRSRLDAANGHEVDENVDPLIEEEAEEEGEEEAEEEEEQEMEEEQEEKKADESMDMGSPPLQRGLAETTEASSTPPPGFSIPTPARCELNDDEIAADEDDDMDEVILFNPFARPNQNHTAMPIGGERNLRTAKAEGSPLREEVVVAQPPLRSNQSELTLTNTPASITTTTTTTSINNNTSENNNNGTPSKPSLYVPPHRQGLDINLRLQEQRYKGPSSRSPPRATPPRKRLAPPPGFPPLPPGFSAAPEADGDSLFSSFQPSPSPQVS